MIQQGKPTDGQLPQYSGVIANDDPSSCMPKRPLSRVG